VRTGWTPTVARPKTVYSGAANSLRPVQTLYEPVEETIPITVHGNDANDVATALEKLKSALSTSAYTKPAIWRHRPYGAITELYAEIYEGTVQERTNNAIGPIEGGNDIDAEIRLVRSPFFGADELIALISAQTVTNTHTGNVLALGVYFGEMKAEGQPLNIRVAKPTAQVAETLFLASVLSRTARTVANAQSTASTSTGVSFTATSAIDVAALHTNNAAVLHLLARFSALTLPAQGQVQATVKTAAGNTLWQSTWKPLGSNTSGQLIDLGEAPLTMLRLPVPSAAAANITITVAIRSVTGATVGATLDYIEALLALDFCRVESTGGLAAGQRYDIFAAQNLSGGGWLPMAEDDGAAFDGSDVPTNTIRVKGQFPRAFEGASLYVAWVDSGNAHTPTDTAALTVTMAPLWRSLRGVL
jgi:phosphotransferase system HPr-like phosphotransfer protein